MALLQYDFYSPSQVASFHGDEEDEQEEAEEDIDQGQGQHMYYPPAAAAALAPSHGNDHHHQYQHQHQHVQHMMSNGSYVQNNADYAPYNGNMNMDQANGMSACIVFSTIIVPSNSRLNSCWLLKRSRPDL